MATITAKNRSKAEKLIIDTMKVLEPAGLNAKKYKELFAKMSDKEFVEYFKRIDESDQNHLYVENDLYGENQITSDSIKASFEFLDVPQEEYFYTRHKGELIRSEEKVPVLYIHLKRMQQLLSKKIRTNVSIDTGNVRSRITGNLNSSSKSGRFTDSDTQALMSITSSSELAFVDSETGEVRKYSPIIGELLNARGDNNARRSALRQQIAQEGRANIEGIVARTPKDGQYGQAVKAIDMYYLGAGLVTDVINPTYLNKEKLNKK